LTVVDNGDVFSLLARHLYSPLFLCWEILDELGYACSGIGDTFAYMLLRSYYFGEMEIWNGKLVAYRGIGDAIDIGA